MPWHNTGAMGNGVNYQYFRQEQLSACGRASVITMLRYIKNKQLTPTVVGRWFAEAEGRVNVNQNGVRDFVNSGSSFSSVIGVLAGQGIQANAVYHPNYIERWVSRVRQNRPGLLSVGWYRQVNGNWVRAGGHWVIALLVHNNQIICLDPDINNSGNTLPLTNFLANPNVNANDPGQVYGRYHCNYGQGWRIGYIDGFIMT